MFKPDAEKLKAYKTLDFSELKNLIIELRQLTCKFQLS